MPLYGVFTYVFSCLLTSPSSDLHFRLVSSPLGGPALRQPFPQSAYIVLFLEHAHLGSDTIPSLTLTYHTFTFTLRLEGSQRFWVDQKYDFPWTLPSLSLASSDPPATKHP